MLGIISAAGNALRAFGSMHPAIKWGVVVLAGLLAVEFVAKEGVAIYGSLLNVQQQQIQVHALSQKPIDFTAGDTVQDEKTRAEAAAAKAQTDALTDCTPSPNYLKAVREARAAGKEIPSPPPCN